MFKHLKTFLVISFATLLINAAEESFAPNEKLSPEKALKQAYLDRSSLMEYIKNQ